jgi:hypothetical protein
VTTEDRIKIKERYTLAKCCNPQPTDAITGYHSREELIKIHKADCKNLENVEPHRLIRLDWEDVSEPIGFTPDSIYNSLEENDLRILLLHKKVGLDYSLKVARILRMEKNEVFNRHKKLRDMGLLKRVPKVMIRYRKGIVDGKWIKHRNHTYYELTEKGESYAKHYESKTEHK